jgi:hypothetical protein
MAATPDVVLRSLVSEQLLRRGIWIIWLEAIGFEERHVRERCKRRSAAELTCHCVS